MVPITKDDFNWLYTKDDIKDMRHKHIFLYLPILVLIERDCDGNPYEIEERIRRFWEYEPATACMLVEWAINILKPVYRIIPRLDSRPVKIYRHIYEIDNVEDGYGRNKITNFNVLADPAQLKLLYPQVSAKKICDYQERILAKRNRRELKRYRMMYPESVIL